MTRCHTGSAAPPAAQGLPEQAANQFARRASRLVLAFTYTKNCIMLSLTHTDGKTLLCMYSIHAYSS